MAPAAAASASSGRLETPAGVSQERAQQLPGGDFGGASLGSKPLKFLCGVAVSVYQNSGDENSNWGWFEKQKLGNARLRLRFSTGDLQDPAAEANHEAITLASTWTGLGPTPINRGSKIGVASDFWNRYEQDIKLARDLGCNSFRMSLEWSRLFPRRGEPDPAAIRRYHDIFDCIERNGMEPNVTLHWFVHPRWFDKLGAFSKEQNIAVYVEWAVWAFREFGRRSKLWATFNEPGVAAMCGFVTGNHPPGRILRFRQAGTYLMNELRAHAAAYRALKALPGGKETAIGIVHNVFWTEPKRNGPLYAHIRAVIGAGNRVWGNESVMTYLKTGKYHYWVPWGKDIEFTDPYGKPGCDFFGLNHYSRGVIDWKLTPTCKPGGRGLADMGYPIYPPSIYRAISYASTLGVPVYVMENGMPSREDDHRRTEWINGYLTEVKKAVEDGYDVRGFMYWTLLDNFEWNFAWELRFGLYEWNDDGSQERRLRKGSEVIKDWYRRLPEELGPLLEARQKPGAVKPRRERERLEQETEVEYLRSIGKTEEQVHELKAQDPNPLVVGVY